MTGKTLTIIGARPQFIKAAPVLKLLKNDVLVNTGQHYDREMSSIFFKDLDIKEANYNLGVGSGEHIWQVTEIMRKLAPIVDIEKPNTIIVYGDTNSTLAGAYIAKQKNIRLIHIEAGLRSYNMEMPEEINRTITDKIADVLVCPTTNSYGNLIKESLHQKAYVLGDTMKDLIVEKNFKKDPKRGEYYLCTLHRPANVDNLDKMKVIFDAFRELKHDVIFPIHPRTEKNIKDLIIPDNVILTNPVGYMKMMELAVSAVKIITDSGGLQKEAHILGVPCVTLRNETEWIESVMYGANKLADIKKDDIIKKVESEFTIRDMDMYGDGHTAQKIADLIND